MEELDRIYEEIGRLLEGGETGTPNGTPKTVVDAFAEILNDTPDAKNVLAQLQSAGDKVHAVCSTENGIGIFDADMNLLTTLQVSGQGQPPVEEEAEEEPVEEESPAPGPAPEPEAAPAPAPAPAPAEESTTDNN